MLSPALPLLYLFAHAAAKNIVISNDDGWATAQIRQEFDTLTAAGHNVRPFTAYSSPIGDV